MNPKLIFSLAIRLLGLFLVYRGLMTIPGVLPIFFSVFSTGITKTWMIAMLTTGWTLLVAWWLLRGAPLLMDLAFPDPASEAEKLALKEAQAAAEKNPRGPIF